MKILIFLITLSAFAQSSLDLIKPAEDGLPKKRKSLQCEDAASIRDFKAAAVEDSGWSHEFADEWARCACPKTADAAGWPNPRPKLPEGWSGALPAINPSDHSRDVERLADEFFLFKKRPLPISRKQAYQIAKCWYEGTVYKRFKKKK